MKLGTLITLYVWCLIVVILNNFFFLDKKKQNYSSIIFLYLLIDIELERVVNTTPAA